MKSRWMAVLALALGGGVVATACSEAPEQSGQTSAAERPVRIQGTGGATTAVDSGVVFVDVRTKREYDAGHVEGAIHIPHTQMDDRHEELGEYRDQQIVVYCQSGRRSGIAERILEDAGFEDVINGGGLGSLRAQGVPTTANCC